MTGIEISPELSLPLDFVTKTTAILAQRRKGKTYTASVLAEELVRAEMPFVVLDPTGAWWGLRAGADGEKAGGLPVWILGGDHGDEIPLTRDSGRLIAQLVIDNPGYYVLDLSHIETRAAERDFSYHFADELYRYKGKAGKDFPLHLFVDEADIFVPQDREQGDNLMLGAFQSIVRRGGLRGLGTTLISQRPALVNKSVLVQLDMLVLLRLVAGNDQDYLKKNYLERAGTKEQVTELMGSFASLKLGEAWVWEPGAEPPLFERVQIRERRTFNSSATPKPGERRVEPKGLADVDLGAVRAAMAETIERAKAEDPKALRSRIRDLEHQLVERDVALAEALSARLDEVSVQGPSIDQADLARLEAMLLPAAEVLAHLDQIFEQATHPLYLVAPDRPGGAATAGRSAAGHVQARRPASPHTGSAPRPARVPAASFPPGEAGPIKAGAHRMLQMLARYGRLTRLELSMLAKVAKGGTLSDYVRSIVGAGYVVEGPWGVELTDAGFALVADVPAVPLSPEEVIGLHNLKAGARRMMDLLLDAHPSGYTRDELSEMASIAKGGTLSDYVRSLTSRGLADETGGIVTAGELLYRARVAV